MYEYIYGSVALEAVLAYGDVVEYGRWGHGPIRKELLSSYLAQSSADKPAASSEEFSSEEFNTARVAYLMQHGWPKPEEDKEPIVVHLEVNTEEEPIVLDGNHRLVASHFLGLKEVDVVFFGTQELLKRWFPQAILSGLRRPQYFSLGS